MLQVQNLSFTYKDQAILHDVNFEVQKGQIIALTGKSGSGKTTLLSLIYGSLEPGTGQTLWNNNIIKTPSQTLVPGQKGVNMLAQEYDLMPFTSVASNVKQKLSRAEPEYNDKQCDELLDVVDLLDFKDKLVKTLSGGQKKRVSIAKTLADNPELLLLDEPFNYIDHQLKDELRRRFFKHIKKQNITCLFVSHEKEELLAFADKILVLSDKNIVRSGSPEELYENPEYTLVAQLFEDVTIFDFEVDKKIAIYPHELQLCKQTDNDFKVTLEDSYFRGANYLNKGFLANRKAVFFTSDRKLQKNFDYYLKLIDKKIFNRRIVKR